MRNSKGITLITLIITLLILSILTAVTMQAFGEGGLISSVETTIDESKVETTKAQIEMSIAKKLITSDRQMKFEDIIDQLVKDGVILQGNSSPYSGQVKTEPDGYVYQITKNSKGNWEVVFIGKGEIEGGTVAPAMDIVLTPNRTTWTNQDITVTATFNGELLNQKKLTCTGVSGTDYVINGTTSVVVKSNNQTVRAVAQDALGNIVSQSITIDKIDKVPPSAPVITGGGDTYASSRTITVVTDAVDEESGVAYYEYYISNSATAPTESTTATGTLGN